MCDPGASHAAAADRRSRVVRRSRGGGAPPETAPKTQLWQAEAGCSMHVYSAREACELLRRTGGLAIGGDSLLRHLYLGLLNVASDDYERGGLDPSLPQSCNGGMQFSEKGCRLARDTADHPIPGCGGAALVRYFDWWQGNFYGQAGPWVPFDVQVGEGVSPAASRHASPSAGS